MPRPNWKLRCFFRVPTSALEFNGKDLRIIFRIQISGTQKSSQPKMGVALGMPKTKKRMTYIMEGCPLLERINIFWQLDLLHAEVECSAMDWDEKTLKDLDGSLPKEGAIHQVRKNDGKFMDPNKKTWVDHGPSHMFFGLAPIPIFFCSLLYCFLQEEAMVKRSYILGMLPPPSSGI